MPSIIRDVLLDTIKKDILGPHEDDERFEHSDHPRIRYICGVLYPMENQISEDHIIEKPIQLNPGEDKDENEEKIPVNVGRKPNSMGITCNVSLKHKFVSAEISYARYLQTSENDKKSSMQQDAKSAKTSKPPKNHQSWQRKGCKPDSILVDLEKTSDKIELEENVFFRYYTQRREKYVILSAFLTNEERIEQGKFASDEKCVFQSSIRLTSTDSSKIFLNISTDSMDNTNLQDKEISFLYRKHMHFAQGHNCSTEWSINETDNNTRWIQTTHIPSYEMPKIEPREPTDKLRNSLSINALAKVTDHHDYKQILTPIADAYQKWINDLEIQMADLTEISDKSGKTLISCYGDIPNKHVTECRYALDRIKEGINKISEDPLIGKAFRFANEVMYESITHTKWAKTNREKLRNHESITEDGPEPFDAQWRLFQMAFLLLTLESITNPNSQYRNTADLLWFPTGGGKTEAYFGIIAFTLAYRRLKNAGAKSIDEEMDRYGVSVIMRYTYRLLTLQQFQRAATLFCACEYVRMKNPQNREWFGSQPFLVGLWVGNTTTPNTFDDAKNIIANNPDADTSNPIQLRSCPWCGRNLTRHNYEWRHDTSNPDKMRPRRIQIRCNKQCFFGKPNDPERVLPVVMVDEDIRDLCPSLLISTVDKFAQIAWNWEYSVLFGNVYQYCKKHGYSPGNTSMNAKICTHLPHAKNPDGKERRILVQMSRRLAPPELIIQDELHLIAGPLGTLVGLYETAIDSLCTNKLTGSRPKIIASTATTKTSDNQLKFLFNSESTKIFPPQGFEFGDSYFSYIRHTNTHTGKMYVGVCPGSVNTYHVDSRISSCILRKIRHIRENKNKFHFNGETFKFSDADLDPYYTMINYYNTIKSLGAAVRMYEDTVPGNMEAITESVEKKFQAYNNAKSNPPETLSTKELTGRINATKIPLILQEVENKITDGDALDAVLCTNMLSVGVDVDRLSVMVVNGQPKSTSEYIQATGRIGRKYPGLVVVNYLHSRARDMSHFENFVQFHSTYHKLVEPGTLTPFSGRARDRGLAGIFMALVRLTNDILSNDPKNFNTSDNKVTEIIEEAKEIILTRVRDINPKEVDGTESDLSDIIKKWDCESDNARNRMGRYSDEVKDLKYRRPRRFQKSTSNAYLLNSSRDSYDPDAFVLPDSLRDAESEINVYYYKRWSHYD